MLCFRLSSLTFLGLLLAGHPAVAKDIRVFAAASTQPALEALSLDLKSLDITVTAVYASSAALARHIEYGAPADVFISASPNWMDYLASQDRIQPTTRRTIATNRLALISNQDLDLKKILPDIQSALGSDRLAIADPTSVPAGRYAKEALILTEQWQGLQHHLAPAKDSTSALMLVVRGETALGIVYASDVKRSAKIKSSAVFPKRSHSPIVYQAAAVRNAASPALEQFLKALSGPQGRTAFQNAGFEAAP